MTDATLGTYAPGKPTLARRMRRFLARLGYLPILTLATLIVASVSTALAVNRVVEGQERRLLAERAGDLDVVLSTLFATVQTSMESVVPAVSSHQQDPAGAFRQAATSLVRPNSFGAAALISKSNDMVRIDAAVGTGLQEGSVDTGPIAATMNRPVPDITQLTTTRVIQRNGERRVGFLVRSAKLPPGQGIYVESVLKPFAPSSITSSSPFREVRTALYFGTSVDSDQLFLATSTTLPLTGVTAKRQLTEGNDSYLMVVKSRAPLAGGLAGFLPYIILGIGLLVAFLVAAIVAVLQRRRRYAMGLVQERTQALSESMRKLQERSATDAMLRRAAHEVANATTVQEAIQAFYRVLREVVPLDRLTIAIADGASTRTLASAGPRAALAPPGSVWPISIDQTHPVHMADRACLHTDTSAPEFRYGVKSIVTLPLVAAGENRVILGLSAVRPGAFRETDVPILEALGRETAAIFSRLLLLEREREAAQRLQELDQLKNEFVSIVAHDLRSPMTVISGFADLLRSQGARFSEEERNEYLGRISSNVRNLAELVEDVLQVARIESGELKCERVPVDLEAMIRQTATEMSSAHTNRNIVIDIADNLPMVSADKQRQWQVFSNLLSNAIKFSSDEQPIEVIARSDADFVEISVRDQGMGMAHEEIPRLFQKFSRVNQPGGSKVPGTGLGLYIARSLVEAQGGRIWVESAVGKGSTFHYTVPVVHEVVDLEHTVDA